MVIKWSLGGESAFGDRPASSMSKFCAAVNSDLGNGSFGVEIRDAKHVDRCSSISTRVWSHQLTSDLKRCLPFWKCLQWLCLKKVSVPSFVVGGLRASTATVAALVICWIVIERVLFIVGYLPTNAMLSTYVRQSELVKHNKFAFSNLRRCS